MRFIEIKDGIFIKADEIESIIDVFKESEPEILCKVYTQSNSYPSILPSSVILEIIEANFLESEQQGGGHNEEVQSQLLNIAKQQSNFAG